LTGEELLQGYYQIIRNRWISGITRFRRMVSRRNFQRELIRINRPLFGGEGIFKYREKIFKSAIYGDIKIPFIERILLDAFFLQRLKYISHLGATYHLYPEARHSRFEHSLGVYFLCDAICKNLRSQKYNFRISEKKLNSLRYAGLLHDIGQGPFSHLTDIVFGKAGRDKRTTMGGKYAKYHEKRGRDMILDQDKRLEQTLALSKGDFDGKLGIKDFLEVLDLDYQFIALSITGEANDHSRLGLLINGPLDADKQDYLFRDSHCTGVTYGLIDLYRIPKMFGINRKGVVGVKEKSFLLVLDLLFSRLVSYRAIVYHHVSIILMSMLYVAIELALELMSEDQQEQFLAHFELMDDSDLLYALELIANFWNKKNAKATKALINKIVWGIKHRVLFKRLAEFRLGKFREHGEFDLIYQLSDNIRSFSACELGKLSSPPNTELSKLAEALKRRNDMVILNVPPISTKEDYKRLLSNIYIVMADGKIKTLGAYANEPLRQVRSKVYGRSKKEVVTYAGMLGKIEQDMWTSYILASDEITERFKKTFADKRNLLKLLRFAQKLS